MLDKFKSCPFSVKASILTLIVVWSILLYILPIAGIIGTLCGAAFAALVRIIRYTYYGD